MPDVLVPLTHGQKAILSLDIVDVDEWIMNAPLAKVDAVLFQIAGPAWNDAVASAAQASIDHADTGAVVLHALANGILKTAAQREAERAAIEGAGLPAPDGDDL